jgi:hypothetical protein
MNDKLLCWMDEMYFGEHFCCNFGMIVSQLYYTTTCQFVNNVKSALLVWQQLMQNIVQRTWQQPNPMCLTLHNFKMYGFGFKRKMFIELVKCEHKSLFTQWLWWTTIDETKGQLPPSRSIMNPSMILLLQYIWLEVV